MHAPYRLPWRWSGPRFLGALLAAAGLVVALALPAEAQFWSPFGPPRRPPAAVPQQPSFNPFRSIFGPGEERAPPQQQAPVDYSHAPAPTPRKADVPAPTTPILVLGDAMADWLAYGLEDAFSDNPDIGIVRKHRAGSGLIRYDPRRDVEWAQAAREIITAEKPKFIVVMIGTNDHQTIREKPPAGRTPPGKGAQQGQRGQAAQNQSSEKQAGQPAGDTPESQAQASADQQNAELEDSPEQPAIIAPERSTSGGPLEFHTDAWEAAYVKRIDAAIVAVKSAGVPVFWVGLPPQRGPRATSDAAYLNELYRGRAERAGIVYVDVWDGFVDEAGRYSPQGPDFEGQIRRLRSGDGVYFTKAGARKLAHYVEREIQRSIGNRALPMALPSEPALQGPGAKPGGPSSRPVVGPVIPLTVSNSGGGDELIGGGRALRPAVPDPIATRVLVKGEPVQAPSGRADDFSWPRGSNSATAEPDASSTPAASAPAAAVAPAAPAASAPSTAAKPANAPAQRRNVESQPSLPAEGKQPAKKQTRPTGETPPRPPKSIGPLGGLFR